MMVGFWSETRLAILLSFKLHLVADFFLLKKLLFGKKKLFRPTKQMAPCYFESHNLEVNKRSLGEKKMTKQLFSVKISNRKKLKKHWMIPLLTLIFK